MNKTDIIDFIDSEIEWLQQARQLLGAGDTSFGFGLRGHRRMSAEARARISAAQKARWAKRKGVISQAGPGSMGKKQRHLSSEARARIAAAQKARWAKVKAQKKK